MAYKLSTEMHDSNVWLTLEQAAAEQNISMRTLRRWMADGMLTAEVYGVRCVMRGHVRQQAYEMAERERKRVQSIRQAHEKSRRLTR